MKTVMVCAKVAMVLTLSGWAMTGCSSPPPPAVPPVIEYQVRNVPGVVEYAWEEPMVDVVEVPPGLDPEGHYYRPAHQEVVEIRQGRWQYYRKPSN
jgi:uncharacterized lipoprotein YmbA